MIIKEKIPPRTFVVGFGNKVDMKDCGNIYLADDEQITFLFGAEGEYDVARKNWGFYATPSVNGRLRRFGLRTAMVKNRIGHIFILLVQKEMGVEFEQYINEEGLEVVSWLDDENDPIYSFL